jgi:hypothetical protein
MKLARLDVGLHCRLIRLLLIVFLAIQVVFFVLSWVVPVALNHGSFFMQVGPEGLAMNAVRAMPDSQRWIGLGLALPALLMLCRGVWHLDRMLAAFQRNAMFAIGTIAHLRGFAGATFLSMALSILEVPLRAIVYRFVLGVPDVRIGAGVTSAELFVILVCGLFYLIAGMMHEGRRLEQENEEFV